MTEKGRHKGTLSESLHKELRVVISGNRSPLSFRIAKWALFLSIAWRLYGTRWFRAWVLGLPVAGLATHLLYRRRTHGWTRPWGGWKDVEAGRPRNEYSGLWRDEDLVFSSKTGSPMSWDNLVRRNLKPLMRKAGLPETTRPYDLRHTFATLMLEQGETPRSCRRYWATPA